MSLLEAGIDFAEDDIDIASDEEILRRLARSTKESTAWHAASPTANWCTKASRLPLSVGQTWGKAVFSTAWLSRIAQS